MGTSNHAPNDILKIKSQYSKPARWDRSRTTMRHRTLSPVQIRFWHSYLIQDFTAAYPCILTCSHSNRTDMTET